MGVSHVYVCVVCAYMCVHVHMCVYACEDPGLTSSIFLDYSLFFLLGLEGFFFLHTNPIPPAPPCFPHLPLIPDPHLFPREGKAAHVIALHFIY